jgi:hypothetical protein
MVTMPAGVHLPETRRRLNAEYRERNREKLQERSRQARRAFKAEALERYGTQCTECGFSDIRALQIDHINNNGAEERKALGGQHFSGWQFYRWLKKQGWPSGYQTLCANCNNIKQWETHSPT